MKHVVNILLLGMVLLGIAMMADTPWGLGGRWLLRRLGCSFPSISGSQKPLGCCYLWGGSLTSSGKLLWLSGLCFGLTCFIRVARSAYKEAPPTCAENKLVGFKIPMILTSASILELEIIRGPAGPFIILVGL